MAADPRECNVDHRWPTVRSLCATEHIASVGYGRIREQFGLQISRFHAIAERIARMAVDLYASDAACRYTAAALDQGERPSVAGAILKVHLTEAGRRAVNDGRGFAPGLSALLTAGNAVFEPDSLPRQIVLGTPSRSGCYRMAGGGAHGKGVAPLQARCRAAWE